MEAEVVVVGEALAVVGVAAVLVVAVEALAEVLVVVEVLVAAVPEVAGRTRSSGDDSGFTGVKVSLVSSVRSVTPRTLCQVIDPQSTQA